MQQSPRPIVERLTCVFRKRFSRPPEAAGISPGRVEILGNHTDYNGGCVLTATIDRYVVAVGSRRNDCAIRVYAEAFDEETMLDGAVIAYAPKQRWSDYIAAAIVGAKQAAKATGGSALASGRGLPGMDIVVGGDLPMGAGLSSSAAMEAAIAGLLLHTADITCEPLSLAEALQAGEAHCAGVQCGLLDQYTVLCGDADTLLVFDSERRQATRFATDATGLAFLLINPHIRRELGGDAPYNQRRAECREAARQIAAGLGLPPQPLCRLPLGEYRSGRTTLPSALRSRSRHVVMEHQRVVQAAKYLQAGAVERFGRLLNASHVSSVRHFENSHPTLDRLQRIVAAAPGCLGCRLTGGGWGGCLLAVTRADDAADLEAEIRGIRDRNGDLEGVDVHSSETALPAAAIALE